MFIARQPAKKENKKKSNNTSQVKTKRKPKNSTSKQPKKKKEIKIVNPLLKELILENQLARSKKRKINFINEQPKKKQKIKQKNYQINKHFTTKKSRKKERKAQKKFIAKEANKILEDIQNVDSIKELRQILKDYTKIWRNFSFYDPIIFACLHQGRKDFVESIYDTLCDSKIYPDHKHFEFILQEDVELASKLYENLRCKNVKIAPRTFHTLIIGFMKHDIELAKDVWSDMEDCGIEPNALLYGEFSATLLLNNREEDVKNIEKEMKERKIKITHEYYAPIVNALIEIGNVDKAEEYLEKMEAH